MSSQPSSPFNGSPANMNNTHEHQPSHGSSAYDQPSELPFLPASPFDHSHFDPLTIIPANSVDDLESEANLSQASTLTQSGQPTATTPTHQQTSSMQNPFLDFYQHTHQTSNEPNWMQSRSEYSDVVAQVDQSHYTMGAGLATMASNVSADASGSLITPRSPIYHGSYNGQRSSPLNNIARLSHDTFGVLQVPPRHTQFGPVPAFTQGYGMVRGHLPAQVGINIPQFTLVQPTQGAAPSVSPTAADSTQSDTTPSQGSPATPTPTGIRAHLPRSDPPIRMTRAAILAARTSQDAHTIDRVENSGMNLMALVENEATTRTRVNIRIERGRAGTSAYRGYPMSTENIPAGTTLQEICSDYPNHVWGTGLRLFLHENMKAQEVYQHLPNDVKPKGCTGRPHNYLQQAFGREQDNVGKELTGMRRIIPKRLDSDKKKKKKSGGQKVKLDNTQDNDGPALTAPGREWTGQGNVVRPPHVTAPQDARRKSAATSNLRSTTPANRGGASHSVQTLQKLINAQLQQQDEVTREIGRRLGYTGTAMETEVPRRAEIRRREEISEFAREQGLRLEDHTSIADDLPQLMHLVITNNVTGGPTGQIRAVRVDETQPSAQAYNWYLGVLQRRTGLLSAHLMRLNSQARGAGGQSGS